MNKLPYLKIEAKNHYDLGFFIGQKLKTQTKKRIATNKKLYEALNLKSFNNLVKTAEKFLPAVKKYYPELLEELVGMAEGAKVSLLELMVLMCEEELMDFKVKHCTSLAVKFDHQVMIGHNEDWLSSYASNGLYLIKAKVKGNKFLALSYMGSLPGTSSGLNYSGFSFTANSLDAGRFRYGVPIKFQLRSFLKVKTVKDALKTDLKDSALVSSSMFAWKNSKILDIEDYFGHHEEFYGRKFLIHTNHPVLKKDQTKINTESESVKRYNFAKNILGEKKPSLKLIKQILQDHSTGICAHDVKKSPWDSVTIASVIINPKKLSMEVATSNPCKNKYIKYSL